MKKQLAYIILLSTIGCNSGNEEKAMKIQNLRDSLQTTQKELQECKKKCDQLEGDNNRMKTEKEQETSPVKVNF